MADTVTSGPSLLICGIKQTVGAVIEPQVVSRDESVTFAFLVLYWVVENHLIATSGVLTDVSVQFIDDCSVKYLESLCVISNVE